MKTRFHILTFSVFALIAFGACLLAQTSGQDQAPTATPNPVPFGSHEIGTKTAPVTVTISNKTGSKLKLTPEPSKMTDYTLEKDGCSSEVDAKGSCTIVISFSPMGEGDRNGEIKVEYSAEQGGKSLKSFAIALTGKGVPSELGISSANLFFPSQRVSTSSAPQAITLTNNSQKDLTISRVSLSGDFSLSVATLPQTLKPSASMVAFVSFNPKQEGAAAGVLTVFSDAGGSPQNVYLSGNTSDSSIALCSASLGTEVSIIAILCLLYWLAMVTIRWNRIARPSRELLRAEITSLRAELETLAAKETRSGIDSAMKLLQAASDLIDRTKKDSGYRVADFLFWSRGQEMTGWGYVHEAEIKMAQLLPEATVNARLESSEQRLRLANDAPSVALANAIDKALTGATSANLDRRRALLAEALAANYQREDNNYADLVSWQNKTSWLVGCGLVLILALTGVIRHHSILFLIGGVGGLLSRLSRSLDRKDVPTDYGASWTTLFLSPVAGALGAWAGILLAGMATKLGILGLAFAGDWSDPCNPMTLGIALVFGFSERLLDSVLDKVVDKSGVDQSTATNSKPPQNTVPTGKAADDGQGGTAVTLMVADQTLPDGKVGAQYSATLRATGTPGGTKWSLVQGSLPPGLKLEQDGAITGTPTTQGAFKFTAGVEDQKSNANRELTITINPAT